MKKFINLLKEAQLLRVIDTPLDCDLEIAHAAYIEAKLPEPKALLFTRPIRGGKELPTPVLCNLFANKRVLTMALGASPDAIAARIEQLLKTHIPPTLSGKISLGAKLLGLKNIAPVRKTNPNAPCKERTYSLSELPILRTWPGDAGEFITMGQVYTRSLDGAQNNLGMYRLQVVKDSDGNDALIGHFQLHKDANGFWAEYAAAGQKMPIAVAIGAHPLHILCAQAPLPRGIFELLLAGFISGKGAQLVRCDSNDLYVPAGSDFVIEGFIDPAKELAVEGPFGDHTGFYTPQGKFPLIEITHISGRKDAIYNATVVGKPPLEDRWMGYATERIFAPLLKTSVPQVLDYHLPEAGAFHNLCLVKINAEYPGAAQAVAHAFWGLGQMAFCKNLIVLPQHAPALDDYPAVAEFVLQNLSLDELLITRGLCDELDHSSEQICLGGKLLVDVCGSGENMAKTCRNTANVAQKIISASANGAGETNFPKNGEFSENLADFNPLAKGKKSAVNEIKEVNLLALQELLGASEIDVFYRSSNMPITCVHMAKKPGNIDVCYEKIREHLHGVVVMFNDAQSHTPYMLLFRALANFDAARDIRIGENGVLIDACSKDAADGYLAPWPLEVLANVDVVEKLIKANVVENNSALFKNYEILSDMDINILKEKLHGNF